MLVRLYHNVKRLIFLVVGAVGLSMAASAYPPSGSEPPVLLGIGAALVLLGLYGVLWPEKVRMWQTSGGID